MEDRHQELGGEQAIAPIVDLGSSLIQSQRGTIYVLTIVGQIEGHQLLPPTSKTTPYCFRRAATDAWDSSGNLVLNPPQSIISSPCTI